MKRATSPSVKRKGLKGLKRYVSNGVEYCYHRATGIRLPADLQEDDPIFLREYLAAQESATQPQKQTKSVHVTFNSVEDVARRYMRSHDFEELSSSYQDVRRRDITRLLKAFDGAIANLPFNSITDRHIRHQMSGMKPNPANERRKTWSALGKFAVADRLIEVSPTDLVKGIRTKSGEGYIPWRFSQIARFREFWDYGTEQRLCFELQYWSGARISDTIGLGAGSVDEQGWLAFRQKKTGGKVYVPFNRPLPHFATPEDLAHLKRAIAAMGERSGTYMLTEEGNPRSQKAASSWFSKAARKAGLPLGRSSHGLRKSRMILHAERGATIHQIAAWSGHETLKEIERYTREVGKRRLLTPGTAPFPSWLETGEFL